MMPRSIAFDVPLTFLSCFLFCFPLVTISSVSFNGKLSLSSIFLGETTLMGIVPPSSGMYVLRVKFRFRIEK